ncbi:3-hydroxyacyl-CoA dehydrogenase [Streptomyces sp. NPDC049597]|uniref:3-hydroxyacyl-CoA dehydrogenase n=1 Tax=Streptomyces sp. NPDC049597 TaxID=3155276 RepID=UPI00341406A8
MSAIDTSRTVAVVGAGTMGQGIAQVALVAGHPVRLYDAVAGRAGEAADAIGARLDRLVEKGRMDAGERDAARARLVPAADLAELADAALVVEAVLEQLAVKQELFAELEKIVADDCLLATNTSSLSVTAVAGALRAPGRFVGLHFFNPAPLLPLVEVVSGHATDEETATRAWATAAAWGKTPVRCADLPGFIVNRIARPFYAEAFAVHEEHGIDPATIDAILRESGGFAMGPFELTDLIGQDVNEAVTRSVWESFFHSPKFQPSLAQRRLVESRRLGRKSGHGWFSYAEGAAQPAPADAGPEDAPEYVVAEGDLGPAAELIGMIREAGITVRQEDEDTGTRLILPSGGQLVLADGQIAAEFGDVVYFDLALDYRTAGRIALSAAADVQQDTLAQATGLFQALGKRVSVLPDVPGMIVARTVAMLGDLALDAVARRVASAEDIDTAMRLGVNYPMGPVEWNERLGRDWAWELLANLHQSVPTGRYARTLGLHQWSYGSPTEDAS